MLKTAETSGPAKRPRIKRIEVLSGTRRNGSIGTCPSASDCLPAAPRRQPCTSRSKKAVRAYKIDEWRTAVLSKSRICRPRAALAGRPRAKDAEASRQAEQRERKH